MNKTNRILGELYYFIGKQQTNFRIFTNYIKSDGSKGFTKWVYYLNATEEELDKATHRTLLKNEIVLDFDPFNNETFEQLKERVNTVCISIKPNPRKILKMSRLL